MAENFEIGSIIEGKVVRIKPFGAIVSLGGNRQGLVHISQIANSFVQDINEHVKVGDIVKVKILSIDEASNKIALSIREALPQEKSKEETNGPRHREQKNNYEPRGQKQGHNADNGNNPALSDFEEKMKEWMKQANERQAGLNKRANRR